MSHETLNRVLIGIPAYNEERHIAKVIKQALPYGDVLILDDGSTDSTRDILLQAVGTVKDLTWIWQKHQGYGSALHGIFDYAKKNNYDTLITLDGDGQHNPEEIPKFLEALKLSDVVIGDRFIAFAEDTTPLQRKVAVKLFNKYSSVSDSQCGFRAYNRKAIESIHIKEDGMGASLEILKQVKDQHLETSVVSCKITYEGTEHSQNTISHGASLLETVLWMTVWERPSLFLGFTGTILLGIGLYSIYTVLYIYSLTRVFVQSWLTGALLGTMTGMFLLVTFLIIWTIRRAVKEIQS